MPSDTAPTLIWIEPAAPSKPPAGAPCNGCGLCCAWQPCPLGMLVSRRRQGRCAALCWSAASGRYQCGVLADPAALWPRLPGWAVPAVQAMARRWIAAGIGCDFDAEALPADRASG